MYISSTFLFLLSAVSATPYLYHNDAGKHKRTTGPAGSSSPATQEGCIWIVDGSGSFTQTLTVDFSISDAFPNDTLAISTDLIGAGSAPYSRQFTTENVAVEDSTLQLKVPGGQNASPILSAQISTKEENILYGSVRTTMQISSVSGTVSASFFYKNDNQEADIEAVTGGKSKGVHYTNQPVNSTADQTTVAFASSANLTSELHEYRLDWLADRTDFYLDGVKQATWTENVPSTAGAWLWNNWSNGNRLWSAGPPNQDNILEISKIEMYYNTTTSAGTC